MAKGARTFRIFVSSTFHDLKEERNALQEKVFPRLRELCMQHGARFQAIDLRWGVSEQASLDQQAMNICLGEIARCQRTTPRPNFIVLLGDRYGWRPLPSEIPADEFEEIERRVPDDGDKGLLTACYKRDDNAEPPEYCLQARQVDVPDDATQEEKEAARNKEFEEWARTEEKLRSILLRATAGMALTDKQRLKYIASATAQEIAEGALQVDDAPNHVFCFFRKIEDLPQDERAKGFRDLVEGEEGKTKPDWEARRQLDNLKAELSKLLGDNVKEYVATWTGKGASTTHIGTLPEKLEDCLKLIGDDSAPSTLCVDVWRSLARVILEEVGGFILEEMRPAEETDPLELEITKHEKFGLDRAKFFVGRDEILETIADYVKGTDPHPLAVWGKSGSGKSALMAKAVQQAMEIHPESELVFRFIGATPESSNGRALLESLCRQISRRYGTDESTIPMDCRELIAEFPERLALATEQKPLILFLDALDQLSDADNARNLAWLPADLPEHVRLVVSTLPGECRSVLKGKLPPENLVELKPMPPEQGSELLDLWLQDAGRTLQQHQRDEVLGKFNEEGNGLPLYLKLAFEEARRWKSYTDREETILRPDVPGVIRDLFARLSAEGNHGEMLVSRSLGYLAAAKNGLTEDELLDVLSRDVELYAWFLESLYHTPPDLVECVQEHLESAPSIRLKEQRGETVDDKAAEEWLNDLRQDGPGLLEFLSTVLAKPNGEGLRLPVVLWSRLYFDLEPYVTKRSGDGTALLGFYHRQLGEVTQEEYLSREDKLQRHQTLAKYFEGQPLQVDRDEQETPNLRKLSELPYQQAHAEMWDEVRATLTHFDFLQTKIDAVGPQPLIGDYAETLNAGFDSQTLRLVEGALRLSNHVLVEDPTQTAGQLTGRLLSSDLPAIQSLLDQTRSWGRPWLRPLTPSLASPGGALIRTLTGHTSLVHEVVVTPDGRRAISVSDSTIKVWDLDSGTELATLAGHSDELVISVAVTPDGRRAISASGDKTLKLWDLDSGTELFTFSGHAGAINRVVVSPDGRRAISSSDDQTLKVWELEAGSELTTLTGHTDSIGSVVVTPDGHRAVSGCADGMLKVWDLETGAELATLTGHTAGRVTWVAVTPDGQSAVSAALDGRLKVWDLDTGTELADLTGHTGFVTMVVVVPGGHRAVSGCADGTLNVWDLDLGTELVTFRGHSAAIHGVAVTPDGSLVISASQDSTLKVWDLESGTELATLTGHSDSVNCVVLTPDGQHAISGSSDGTLMMWDLDAATGLAALPGHSEWVSAVALTADARRGVSASRDGTLKVWDLDSGTELATLTGHSRAATGVAVTPDGRRALSASWDKTLKLWDLNSGTELATLAGHGSSVYDVAITPDGRRAISASNDKTLKVWDLHSATELATLAGHTERVWRVRVTPGGRRALSASWDKTLKVWDLDSGTELAALTGHNREVKGMVVTPDGRRAVSVAADLSLVVWDLDGGSLLGTLSGHKSGLYDVAITPDGRRALSASWDKTLMLWDLNSGTELATLTGHTEGVRRVVVTPDGRHAVSASADRTLKVWDLRDATLLATFTSGAEVVATAVSPSPTGPTILAGDRLGQVHIVRLEGIDRVPMQAPVLTAHRMWLSGERGRNGRWEDEITAVCQWCGQRSPVEDEVLSTITSITREADLSPHQSPCVELLTEVWGEPGLLSECARCHGRLRFNPFLVDNREQEPLWREAQEKRELARSLRDQAKALKDQGDLDHALSLHREEERIYIELGDDGSLALCLASQGMILHALGEFGAAMAAFQEAEPLYRQSGDIGGVATMISNQAFLLGKMGRAQAALPLAEAAHRLATDHGLTSKAEGIGKILEFLRRKAAG